MGTSARKSRTVLVVGLAVLGSLGLFCGFAAIIGNLVFGMMRSSEPYQQAMKQVRLDPKVAEQLGTPLEEGFFVQGQINTSDSRGKADLSIPVSGPRGEAVVEVHATAVSGAWTLHRLAVRFEGSGEVLVLAASPAEAPER